MADLPARYIMLIAPQARPTDTLIFDTRELIEVFGFDHLKRCLFLQYGRTSHYCRLVTMSGGEPIFRYNKAVMTPKNDEAESVAAYIEDQMECVQRVDWTESRIAAMDNWTTLHSRDACGTGASVGLFRFAIWGAAHDMDY
ncbi:MAG: TauD/TfdA family dioxygenase [Alphaproteobacteria bacterium]|nr:TauD/TfdA family dioxygenase [Alphaproteobacteria bacterium]